MHQNQLINLKPELSGFWFLEAMYQSSQDINLSTESIQSAIAYVKRYYGRLSLRIFTTKSKKRQKWFKSMGGKNVS